MSKPRLKKGKSKACFIKTLPKKGQEAHLLEGDKPMVQFPKLVYFLNQNNSLPELIASINWFNS